MVKPASQYLRHSERDVPAYLNEHKRRTSRPGLAVDDDASAVPPAQRQAGADGVLCQNSALLK